MTDEHTLWSETDRKAAARFGIGLDELASQIQIFRRGVRPARLSRPCVLGDGIAVISERERPSLLEAWEEATKEGRLMKFVPASGAASRMFREWHLALAQGGFSTRGKGEEFISSLERYAFYKDLIETVAADGLSLSDLVRNAESAKILDFVLTGKGLNYGNLPKALIKFHSYPDGARTALHEHLVESALYVRDQNKKARVHFTVSGEHEKAVRDHLRQILRRCERDLDTVFAVGISIQDPATNTIAVDLDKKPFRDPNGDLFFRPAGHGALIANLNRLEGDIVFIKNIDNVVTDAFKDDTTLWKKLLAGYLVSVQKEIFTDLVILEQPNPAVEKIADIVEFCRKRLNITLPQSFESFSGEEKRRFLFDALNRPLRVCGMVKNGGEPGGGPFWVQNRSDNSLSLQIVEESEVDLDDPEQKEIWSSSTHFNPVDLVCGLLDYRGRKFNLEDFIDRDAAIITRKSQKGRDILVLERPGLWNGSMAFWNTIFVEVPLTTFNPVKTINDLLRPYHQ